MSDMRKGELDSRKKWFRSGSRVFANRGMWYFQTREGTVEGPFADKYSAEKVLEGYTKVMGSNFASTTEFSLVEEGMSAPRAVSIPDLGIGRARPER